LRGNISSWVCAAPIANEVPSGHKPRGIPNTASPEPNAVLFLSLGWLQDCFHCFSRYRQFAGDHYGAHRQCVLPSLTTVTHLQTRLAAGVSLRTIEPFGLLGVHETTVLTVYILARLRDVDGLSDFRSGVRRQMG
jgi:hypothetical protein